MEHTNTDSSMVVSPMEGSAELDSVTEEVRKKRALPLANAEKINDLAMVVLMSIDSIFAANDGHDDDGQCLFRTLCESNKISRSSPTTKYWIPLWGCVYG